ncbi:carbohydrate ABC transporter permease [Pseudogracilibacillus auburnensis]|uniref:carbohydrate ABC transporter permease n=1 Tax=Pseudogracilibacillus auburnensis TaxID=1494959 RepID=UPI001A961805|nr:sugar ABC transporter permease [Pseudogracilibacillus auburnensis]MBO1004830.1 sugar ABC transporter permease [Pseudogracilibacillus auburnensis]
MKKKWSLNKSRREMLTGYMFVLPWIIGFSIFMAYPIYSSLKMSFSKVFITPTGIKTEFIKWDNYKYAFLSDPKFVDELLKFVQSIVLTIPIVIVFSLFVALLINQHIKGQGIFRAVFFLPVVITSGAVVNELFSQGAGTIPMVERYGIITYIESNLSSALADPLITVIQQLIIILWFSGVQMLIFLSALQKINRQVYEAAAIDGASPWEMFWKITLPSIKPFILVNLVYTTVDMFTNSVNKIIEMIKDHMFELQTGFGYSSALAWIYLLVILIVLLIILIFYLRSEGHLRFRKLQGR